MTFLPIQTARLVLRRFRVDDVQRFQGYRQDPAVGLYQGWKPMSDAEARSFLEEQSTLDWGKEGEWLQVAVALREGDDLIGDLGLCTRSAAGGVMELGYTLAGTAWGRGYATEAVAAVLDGLFGKKGAQSVLAVTDVLNSASAALLRRLDFALDHTGPAFFRGEPCEEHTFVMTAARWFDRPGPAGPVQAQ